MRQVLFLLLVLLLLTACRKKEEPSLQQHSESFQCMPNWGIKKVQDTLLNGEVKDMYTIDRDSNMSVLRYIHYYDPRADVIDEEYVLAVILQMSVGATSFHYQNEELSKNLTYYLGENVMARPFPLLINNGRIEGHKLSDSAWVVDMDVALPKKDDVLNIDRIQHKAIYSVVYY